MDTSAETLLWDPVQRRQYRLTRRSDGRGERTYVPAQNQTQATPPPPRTSSSNPLALPLGTNAPRSGNLRPATLPQQPIGHYGAQRQPAPSGPQAGSSGHRGNLSGTQPAISSGNSAQYGYARTANAQDLTSGMGGLALAASQPGLARVHSGQTTTASVGERRTSAVSTNRPPTSSAVSQSFVGLSSGTGQVTPAQGLSQPYFQQRGSHHGTDIHVAGSRSQRLYSGFSSAPSTTPGYTQGTVSPYESQLRPSVPQTTSSSRTSYNTQPVPSPYSTNTSPVITSGAPSQPSTRTFSSPPAQNSATTAAFTGRVEVEYQTRSGGQGSSLGQQAGFSPSGQYRPLPSVNGETFIDGIAEYLTRGTEGQSEKLDRRFQVRSDHWQFFIPGRVFKMLTWEQQGSNGQNLQEGPSVWRYGEEAFAKVYRYVVVRARPKQAYSLCLRISTYGERGTAKKNVDQSEHAIIYTGNEAPKRLPEEKRLTKDSIRVMAVGDHQLEKLSRINFAKVYPVEHNVKVWEVGEVAGDHLRTFLRYWQNETERGFLSNTGRRNGSSRGQRATPSQGRRRHE